MMTTRGMIRETVTKMRGITSITAGIGMRVTILKIWTVIGSVTGAGATGEKRMRMSTIAAPEGWTITTTALTERCDCALAES